LQVAEELHVALLVEGQEIEGGSLGQEGLGVGQREHVVLDGAGAVESPAIFRDGVGKMAFHRGFGVEAVDEFVAEGFVASRSSVGRRLMWPVRPWRK
jgi:hypothetical protein